MFRARISTILSSLMLALGLAVASSAADAQVIGGPPVPGPGTLGDRSKPDVSVVR